jgi:hypothetical protein
MFFNFISPKRVAALSCLALALLASSASAARQKTDSSARKAGPAQAGAGAVQSKPNWSVKVSKSEPHTFTVKAADARLVEVAAEIAKAVHVPITLSPLLRKQRVTLDFGGLNLDATLRMLAPSPVVDYELGGDDPQPKALAIYLQGFNEQPPAPGVEVRGAAQVILIEGDTEEGTDEAAERKRKEEEALKVSYANSQLSLRARKQSLSVVLFRIASEVGVPFDLRYESTQIIDVEFDNYPLDQAVRSLSPEVRLYYRQDLQTFQIKPLRLALVRPAAAKS